MAVPGDPEGRREGRRALRRDHGQDGGRASSWRSSTLPAGHRARQSLTSAGRLTSRGLQGPSRPGGHRVSQGAAASEAQARRGPAIPRPDGPERAAPERPGSTSTRSSYEQLRSMDLTITQSRRVLAYRNRVERFESIDELERDPGLSKDRPGAAQAPTQHLGLAAGPGTRKLRASARRCPRGDRGRASILPVVAKDTEKLIRQLSLISFLMANGRPVSALEIKREVEGYSSMNEDAFARRFYADRAELESLGISLQVEKPAEGFFEAELYALPPENYYLPPIEFTDGELAALRTALGLARRRVRLRRAVAPGAPAGLVGTAEPAGGGRLGVDRRQARPVRRRAASCRSAWRRSRPRSRAARRSSSATTRCSATRSPTARSIPTTSSSANGQFYLIGHSHERDEVRVFRLSRIRGKVSYATKAEHDFAPPEDFDRRDYASRADWQMGEIDGNGEGVRARADRLARRARLRRATASCARRPRSDGAPGRGAVYETEYASSRAADLLGARLARERDPARAEGPGEGGEPSAWSCCASATRGEFAVAKIVARPVAEGNGRPSVYERPLGVGDPPRALRPAGHPRRPPDRRGAGARRGFR